MPLTYKFHDMMVFLSFRPISGVTLDMRYFIVRFFSNREGFSDFWGQIEVVLGP